MSRKDFDIIVIGGSSGSIGIIVDIFRALPAGYNIPIVVILHRLKNVKSDLGRILSINANVHEPDDKELIENGCIYLAPQNYHLLIEGDKSFSLDYSELVHYSRPSIDVTFTSAAHVYGPGTLGILLSGANRDGAEGLRHIIEMGGCGIVQDPATAESPVMPLAALENSSGVEIQNATTIVNTMLRLS